jgi:hypothetical protein
MLWIWQTHLSTAATIGDTVIAAVKAVAASIRSLAGMFLFSTSGIVAIRSTELTLMVVSFEAVGRCPECSLTTQKRSRRVQEHDFAIQCSKYQRVIRIAGLSVPPSQHAVHHRITRMLFRPEVVTPDVSPARHPSLHATKIYIHCTKLELISGLVLLHAGALRCIDFVSNERCSPFGESSIRTCSTEASQSNSEVADNK